VGVAPDPYAARELLVQLKPDVITLDIEMPKMSGLDFLQKVMEHFPTRAVVVSSLTQARAPHALRALELGAVDVMPKPEVGVGTDLGEAGRELIEKVKAAAKAIESPLPQFKYSCSLEISRKTYNLESYRLNSVAYAIGHEEFKHHDALADADACARIMVHAADRHGVEDIEALLEATGKKLKVLVTE
jgi:chemotaxis response regulator CheB